MKVLGLIPARGGSKGVVRKNIRLLNGKPLLAYTAETARRAKNLSRIILSTDDAEIAETGRKYGLEVPFMRPAELATDIAPSVEVVRHALIKMLEAGENFDAVCLLQPTNPLRRAEDIDNCIELLELSNADGVISLLPVPPEFNPNWVYQKARDGSMKLINGDPEPVSRRQDLPPAFYRDGSVYLVRESVLIYQKSLYGRNVRGYLMNPEFSANIDTEADWRNVEKRMSEKLNLQAVTK